MKTFLHIADWIDHQHVLTYCVNGGASLWCASAFYAFDRKEAAFYLLSDPKTRHGQMAGKRAEVAGTISDQTKTVLHIRGLQFHGELRLLEDEESKYARKGYYRQFPAARLLSAPVWSLEVDELKFTDNTLGFGKKLIWLRDSETPDNAQRVRVSHPHR